MQQDINEGGITYVDVRTDDEHGMELISVFVRHQLGPEKVADFEAFVEALLVRAISAWAKL